jgi:predicted RNA binding protein YcfA (HicA-like mRNA interferase family)
MGRLRSLSGREVCGILRQHGFVKVRQRGSHIIMQLRTEDSTVTVPVPNHPTIRRGTLRSIIRQSGLSRLEFEN